MRKIKPFWADTFREIRNTKVRCLSLMVICMLGAAALVGIQATAINMRDDADREYKERRLYDVQLKSAIGFSGEDVARVRETHGVSDAMPTYIFDVYADVVDEQHPVRTYALPDDLNTLKLVSGNLPNNAGECAVEHRLFVEGGYSLGDSISFRLGNMDVYNSVFETETYTITAVVSSPLYLTFERGRTTLGNGSVRYYVYLHPDSYKLDVHTDIYVLMEASTDLHNVSEDYKTAAGDWKRQFESAFPQWLALTREDGTAFESYYQDTMRLQSVGYVFPMVFYLVAVLVSLTSMTRMVEEHRTQIGVYKAMGFRPAAIMLKYVLYALLSSISGGILGALPGSKLITLVIGNAYGHLYDMPPTEAPIPAAIAGLAITVSAVLLSAVTVITCASALGGEPSELMRPKMPKAGKRVFLERIPLIWNRMGFIGKVTARNIFRFKKRFLMTLVGVAGCAALLLTAFSLRESVGSVAIVQYGTIAVFDATVYTNEITALWQREELDALMPDSRLYVREESVTVGMGALGTTATLIAPENFSQLYDYINLPDVNTSRPVIAENAGALVTEKLARTWEIEAGDTFTVTAPDGVAYSVEAAGIVENYIMHYVYLPPEYYVEVFGRELRPNAVLLRGEADAVGLMKSDLVRTVIDTEHLIELISDSTDALGAVTIVLLVIACALAFVVLFNLTLINITERKRELATIKVLGFQDSETALYMYREIFLITLMGIALGIACGIWLTMFVLRSIEVDILIFPIKLSSSSFGLAAVLSIAFAMFVNAVTYRMLVSIDMVESLKSIE